MFSLIIVFARTLTNQWLDSADKDAFNLETVLLPSYLVIILFVIHLNDLMYLYLDIKDYFCDPYLKSLITSTVLQHC